MQKQNNKIILLVCIVLIVMLSSLMIFDRREFQVTQTTTQEELDYQALLDSYQIDQEASKKTLQNIVSEDDVKLQVNNALHTNQKISVPSVPKKTVGLLRGAKEADDITALTDIANSLGSFYTQHAQILKDPMQASSADIDVSLYELEQNIDTLYSIKSTEKTEVLHKQLLVWQENMQGMLVSLRDYKKNPVEGTEPWPRMYHDLVFYNTLTTQVDDSVKKLAPLISKIDSHPSQGFISTAHAIPVVVVGNVFEEIKDAVKQSLSAAFARFASVFLDKLIGVIEKNYRIANFLYYSDALVSGQYVDDYLKKYIDSPLDRVLVKKFIPQISCGKNDPQLHSVFKAKAREYLGYNPDTLSPNDPDFTKKMARMGDYLSTSQGWELHFRELASAAASEAEKNVNRELLSPGLKSPRDIVNNQISATISAIEHSESAALLSSIQLGVIHVDSIVGQIVSNILNGLFDKFLFKGASVYAEQPICLVGITDKPIVPAQSISPAQLRGDVQVEN